MTIVGGVLVAAALLLVLYYNHYYLERAQVLTAQLASLDPRAGAYNRRAFEERMRQELDHLSYGDRDALAVVMIDLGNFKSVSANYGRVIGDKMLTEVAAALTAASRDEDCVARLGGDRRGRVRDLGGHHAHRAAAGAAQDGRRPGVPGRRVRRRSSRRTPASRSQLTADEELPPCVDQLRFFAGAARVLEGRASGEYLKDHTSPSGASRSAWSPR